jgi:hypothetical protein
MLTEVSSTLDTQLLPCRRCGTRLPSGARSCALCGIAHPHAPAWGAALLFGLVLLVIVVGRFLF